MTTISVSEETPVWRDPRAIALLLAASLKVMANATISPALPGLEDLFASDPDAALLTRLLVPAPSLAVVVCAPLAGVAVDRFGRRRLLLSGVLLFAIAGCAGLFLPDLTAILASRLVLGVAVALIMTSQTALIGDYFAGDRRTSLMGLETSARNFGGFLCISLAGALATISPRLPFAIYGLAALLIPFIWTVVSEPRSARPHGGASQDDADGHPAWAILLVALAALQVATNMAFFIMPTQLPFFLDASGYRSAATTGAVLSAMTITGGFVALLYGRIKRTLGHASAFALGYALMALGFALLSVAGAFWTILAGAAAIGAGYSTALPNFVAIALRLAPARRRGLAGGVLTSAVFVGQFVSPFVSMPAIAALGYDGMFRVAAMALGALALAAVLAPRN